MKLSLDQLFQMEMEQLVRERGRDPNPAQWRWSPTDIRQYDVMLHVAYDHLSATQSHRLRSTAADSAFSIWEAGSGIGTKLYLAKHKYLMTEYGFEYEEDYIEAARELGVACEWRDLSDLDNQPSWEVPDIVFTARPFKDDLFEKRWEQLVQDRMREGAVLIQSFKASRPYDWHCLYHRSFQGVYVKPTTHMPGRDDLAYAQTVT
jgi:hypothetical protein